MRRFLRLATLLALMAAFSPAGAALARSSVVTEHARSSLVAAEDGVAPGGVLSLAFAQELEEGWHVYWKNQGDSGLPLEFIWTLPDGASAGPIDYPTPERIEIGPLVNFGHEGEPIFLTTITAPDDAIIGSTLLEIGLEATWLICADICVPETGSFSLSIPIVASPLKNSAAEALFASARAAQPSPFDGAATFAVSGNTLTIEFSGAAPAAGAYFFPDTEGVSEPAAEQRYRKAASGGRLTVQGGPALAAIGDRLDGVVIFDSRGVGPGYAVSAQRSAAIPGASAASASLFGLLAAAFIGGALLNLMPCVFPILFVKAASMAKSAASDRGAMRRHGVLYTLGVVATFSALGGLLLALRAGGEQLGWGFHLQSPAIVALSAYVLFAVGLNLAGAFHIGSSLQNVGSGLVAARDGDLSAFLTGVLAVFVAAPCVGPFLTAPIGAAAVLPPASGMAIFLAMALGLAAPYAAISFAPGVARALPKPGPWMDRFRQALSFPVFAAAAYFLWVLTAQTGARGLAYGLAGIILLALAARVFEWGRGARWRAPAAALVLALALAPVFLLQPTAATAPSEGVIAFDPADIERRRAAGEPLFIDFTAAWCVTCQVNKLTVLSSAAVKSAFADAGVAIVTADWTNRDPVIEKALAGFGANGVPLYVYYPPGAEAVILPQPLTERAILGAVSPGK